MIYDVAIIGGGVVGCAIFNKLIRLNQKCILIEKENDVATVTTKANSGVVHAGFDAKTDSLKAKLNVLGATIFPKLCEELGVPYKQNGAFVLGDDKNVVINLYDRGINNGVQNLQILNREELLLKIPNLGEGIKYGLFAPTSAIVSPYLFSIALAEEGILNGGEVKLNYNITNVLYDKSDDFIISNGKDIITAKSVVNATGGSFNEVSKIIGGETYDINYKRGEYYLLDKTAIGLTPYTLFPLPSNLGKGVLITPTIDGNILIGPTSTESDRSLITTSDGLNRIYEKSNSMLKNIPYNKNIRVFSGIRTIVGDDFVIENSRKIANLINVVGICSPGLASSPAIAEYVAIKLKITGNEKVMKKRIIIPKIAELPIEEVNNLIKKDKQFGEIICSCECVSKAEIIMAINSPLRPKSVDAIKRRVRAGMGRCQGGSCFTKVMKTISEFADIKFDNVEKEHSGSNFIVDDVL